MRRKRYRRNRHEPQYLWHCVCGWEGIRTAKTAARKECPKCKRSGSQKRVAAVAPETKRFKRPKKNPPPQFRNPDDPPPTELDFL